MFGTGISGTLPLGNIALQTTPRMEAGKGW